MNKTSLTIGLPIYNEGANIKELIRDILSQKQTLFKLDSIIISSDGSTDDTIEKLESIKNNKIRFINNRDRKGIKRGLKQILDLSRTNILVLLDGDIRISDKNFLNKLIKPILEGNAHLTSCRIAPLMTPTFVSKILYQSMTVKDAIFDTFNNGVNIYSCHGQVRAYSKPLYQGLKFPVSVGNDMYSYLDCLTRGFSYSYVLSTFVYYKLPTTFIDHVRQGVRYRAAKLKLLKYFDQNIIREELQKPLKGFSNNKATVFKAIISKPILSISYFFLNMCLSILPVTNKYSKETWEMASSSK